MTLDPHLRSIIVCPQCHGPLTDSPAEGAAPTQPPAPVELLCPACALAFPVVDEIPVLLLDDARPTR